LCQIRRSSSALPRWGFLILSVVLASAIPTAETTVGSDTFQITVEDGITIAAPRKTSRAINRREASDYGEPTRTTRTRMSEPAGAGSPIPAEVIPQLAAVAHQVSPGNGSPRLTTLTTAQRPGPTAHEWGRVSDSG
jgi:hypothetical protein